MIEVLGRLEGIYRLYFKIHIQHWTKHPYTKALISASPIPNPDIKRDRIILKGEIPSPIHMPIGCVFHTRCQFCMDICKIDEPKLIEKEEHSVACHLVNRFD